jgi:hypothetical protein
MKYYHLLLICLYASSCSNQKNNAPASANNIDTVQQSQSFFPVTSYIKGQIFDIRQRGLTPVHYVTQNNHTDSAMIKFENLDTLLAEFLNPVIDTVNLTAWFNETKFLDQTVNAVTFTYEPKATLPDTLYLQRWDVYIDPETGKVRRVYLVKKPAIDKTLQLTWQSNKWCSIVTLNNKPGGSTTVEKEEKILWDY